MKQIFIAGLTKYEKKLELSKLDPMDKRFKKLHQPSGRCPKRLKKKAMARQKWFKEKGPGDDESVAPSGRKNVKKRNFQRVGHHISYSVTSKGEGQTLSLS